MTRSRKHQHRAQDVDATPVYIYDTCECGARRTRLRSSPRGYSVRRLDFPSPPYGWSSAHSTEKTETKTLRDQFLSLPLHYGPVGLITALAPMAVGFLTQNGYAAGITLFALAAVIHLTQAYCRNEKTQ